ncbi:MAG: type I 3-dehydroquinate dehydratase [Coprococcus sp.]
MGKVIIRNVAFGNDIPKVCAPIVGTTTEEILAQAEKLTELPVDVAEWRADWMGAIFDDKAVLDVLEKLRMVLGDMPLLMTFRTKKEGGEQDISHDDYEHLYELAINSGYIDMLDLELMFFGECEDRAIALIEKAHSRNTFVIMSSHDFKATPDKEEILRRLRHMEKLKADILKIAVMPCSRRDVLTLLSATEQMSSETDCPLVTMSMGGLGLISRLSGEVFGSAMTFGSAGKASAPGQIDVCRLKEFLSELHRNMPDNR